MERLGQEGQAWEEPQTTDRMEPAGKMLALAGGLPSAGVVWGGDSPSACSGSSLGKCSLSGPWEPDAEALRGLTVILVLSLQCAGPMGGS